MLSAILKFLSSTASLALTFTWFVPSPPWKTQKWPFKFRIQSTSTVFKTRAWRFWTRQLALDGWLDIQLKQFGLPFLLQSVQRSCLFGVRPLILIHHPEQQNTARQYAAASPPGRGGSMSSTWPLFPMTSPGSQGRLQPWKISNKTLEVSIKGRSFRVRGL